MANESLDPTGRRILDLIQRNFPLVPRPFRVIAGGAATSERDVLERIARLKREGMVREICAVFDAARLGYHSTLAAMAVEPGRLEEVAAMIGAHPGVSHNYERLHEFNLWFTLTIPGDRSIAAEIEGLAHKAGCGDFLNLPALRRFKIGVDFDLGTRDVDEIAPEIGVPAAALEEWRMLEFGPRERSAVRVLQRDLPLVERPFAQMAERISMDEKELLARADLFLTSGVMRRFGAILHHRRIGYGANGMVGWTIAPDRIEEAGRRAAAEQAVSHCYERPSFPPRWPYNLMTMIHGRTEDELREVVKRLEADLQPSGHAMLFSGREFKKQRVHYFEEEK
jgi:DNA-binding Lrp family transcriptional regulator